MHACGAVCGLCGKGSGKGSERQTKTSGGVASAGRRSRCGVAQGWKTGVNGTDLWGMLAASFAWIPTTVGPQQIELHPILYALCCACPPAPNAADMGVPCQQTLEGDALGLDHRHSFRYMSLLP